MYVCAYNATHYRLKKIQTQQSQDHGQVQDVCINFVYAEDYSIHVRMCIFSIPVCLNALIMYVHMYMGTLSQLLRNERIAMFISMWTGSSDTSQSFQGLLTALLLRRLWKTFDNMYMYMYIVRTCSVTNAVQMHAVYCVHHVLHM